MPVYGILRKNKVDTYLSDEELRVVRRMADKQGVPVAEYIRIAIMVDACESLDLKAWKLTYNNASRRAKEWLRKKMFLKGEGMVKET
jgi:16S rRNA U516 pseudouridylate synthase RsuA-like enzyme